MESGTAWTASRVRALRQRLGLSKCEMGARLGYGSRAAGGVCVGGWEKAAPVPQSRWAALDRLDGVVPGPEVESSPAKYVPAPPRLEPKQKAKTVPLPRQGPRAGPAPRCECVHRKWDHENNHGRCFVCGGQLRGCQHYRPRAGAA